jgi:hypothetical protein
MLRFGAIEHSWTFVAHPFRAAAKDCDGRVVARHQTHNTAKFIPLFDRMLRDLRSNAAGNEVF